MCRINKVVAFFNLIVPLALIARGGEEGPTDPSAQPVAQVEVSPAVDTLSLSGLQAAQVRFSTRPLR